MAARPATTDDLDRLEARLEGRLTKALNDEAGTLRKQMSEMKTELRGEMSEMKTELRGEMSEMKTELRDDMSEMKTELRDEMTQMERRLVAHIADASVHTAEVVVERMRAELARHVAASAEETRSLLRVIDDKYSGLPDEVAALRREIDARCEPVCDSTGDGES